MDCNSLKWQDCFYKARRQFIIAIRIVIGNLMRNFLVTKEVKTEFLYPGYCDQWEMKGLFLNSSCISQIQCKPEIPKKEVNISRNVKLLPGKEFSSDSCIALYRQGLKIGIRRKILALTFAVRKLPYICSICVVENKAYVSLLKYLPPLEFTSWVAISQLNNSILKNP